MPATIVTTPASSSAAQIATPAGSRPRTSRVAACNAQLATDKQDCQTAFPDDPAGLDQCIDNAQLKAFVCRDSAREQAGPGFESCRQQFKTCVQTCPPSS
jgi:hypothetical protein